MSTPKIRRTAFVLFTAVLATGPVSAVNTLAQTPAASGSGQPAAQLTLTMQQAVDMALEANLGLKGDKLSTAIQAESVSAARSFYLPVAFGSASRFNSQSAPQSFLDANVASVTTRRDGFNAGVQQQLRWYGGNYRVQFAGSRNEDTKLGNTFNPTLGSSLSVSLFQPLLRNFKTDSARVAIKTSQIQQQITDIVLLESIARTERDARFAYLSLIGAIEGRKVNEKNLDVARESLRGNRARLEVGLMAPADIVDAEAAVSDREEALIIADGQIERAMDQLRQVIMDPSRPDYWTVRIVPTETITAEPHPIDIDAAVKTALESRADLVQARKNLDITRATLSLIHNQALPNVDLQVNYTGTGTAGTHFTFVPGSFTDVESQSSRGFFGAVGDAFGYVQPAWTYSVQVGYPIGRSADKANYARNQLQERQAEIQLREGELAVATAVRDAGRQVETNFKRVQASQTSLQAQQKRLEAEQKRFDVGTSDTFKLFQVQRDVAAAAVSELQARLAYAQAIINFEAVQKIR
jgi:outer membrane protein TolC